ncbi:MAG TPA: hypothetical protein VNE71_04510 [Myxococcota bacterium]|nr:hypothetical protein [Myxococcota bacterium]
MQGRRLRPRASTAALLAALIGAAGSARAQVQTPDQRACTSAMNGALAGVAAAATRGVGSCVRAASRATLPAGTGIETCAAGDPKLEKAAARAGAAYDARCAGEGKRPPGSPKRPPYGVTDAAVVGATGGAAAADLARDLLGADLDLAVLLESAGKDAARCQQLAAREASACAAARLREFGRCVRAGLKDGSAPFDGAADLAGCFGADPKGAVAKRCEQTPASRLAKRCTAKGVDLAQALPACNAADAAGAVACLDRAAACRACRAVADAGSLEIDCDLADDGAANASCAVPLGTLACPFDPDSSFFLESDSIFFGGTLTGSVAITCGAPDPGSGVAPCTCDLEDVAPIETAGGLWACVSPAAGCAPGAIACDGGPSRDARIDADHDVGVCTGNADCAAQCGAHCGAAAAAVWDSGCEGFCEGGSADGTACAVESDCPGGACNGIPNLAHGNVCGCQCLDLAGAPSTPGGLRCNLGARIRIEAALPCDGVDVLSDTGDRCLPLTTETTQATLVDRDHEPGETLPSGVDVFSGTPVGCDALRADGPAGMLLFSTANAFDVPLAGDAYLVFALGCD